LISAPVSSVAVFARVALFHQDVILLNPKSSRSVRSAN
jgi:hypothetical protein